MGLTIPRLVVNKANISEPSKSGATIVSGIKNTSKSGATIVSGIKNTSESKTLWTKLFTEVPNNVKNHPTHSPINVHVLLSELALYNKITVARELALGFANGFRLGFTGIRKFRESKNLVSITQNESAAIQKINKEVELKRISGPHKNVPFTNFMSSPIGLVPKKEPGKFRLIQHLSWPEGKSINDFIDPEACTVKYARFDDAVKLIQNLGKHSHMAKCDVASTFLLLPLQPDDHELTGFKLLNDYYYDMAMPMGCSISCATWEKFSTFIEWAVRKISTGGSLLHYIDDFLFVGRQGTLDCENLMKNFHEVCQRLGVPIAPEKTEGPTNDLVFLGLKINSSNQTVTIPIDKVISLREAIKTMLAKKKCTLKEIQSIIGSLNFACRAIAPGRAFLRRLIGSIKKVDKPHFYLRITPSMRGDLTMWLEFLDNHNGVSIFKDAQWYSKGDYELFTDSAASKGMAIYMNGKWAQARWGENFKNECKNNNITFLEYFPILVSIHIFEKTLANKKILFHCDNEAVVEIINSQSSKCPRVMDLVRPFVLKCLQLNTIIKAQHIKGTENSIADAISRFNMQLFRELAPEAEENPQPIPQHLWML